MTQNKPKTSAQKGKGESVVAEVVMKISKQKGPQASKVRFGSVVVSATAPKQVELRRNVSTGQIALGRAATKIIKAGISLSAPGAVPLYRADPRNPARLIRELNGKLSTGVFVDGKFKISTKR